MVLGSNIALEAVSPQDVHVFSVAPCKCHHPIIQYCVTYVVDKVSLIAQNSSSSSFPFPFVPLQQWGCLVAPLFL
jgi:hypothetical protein